MLLLGYFCILDLAISSFSTLLADSILPLDADTELCYLVGFFLYSPFGGGHGDGTVNLLANCCFELLIMPGFCIFWIGGQFSLLPRN